MSVRKGAVGMQVPEVLNPESTRRRFFAALCAPILAYFTPKPTTVLSSAPMDSPTVVPATATAYMEDGHLFYSMSFHPVALTMEYPRIGRGTTITIKKPKHLLRVQSD